MTVTWSPKALDRVYEIADYLHKEHQTDVFDFLNQIFDRTKQLELFPESGRMVPEVNRLDIRELIWRGYRIVYQVKAEEVEVLTVRHGRQQWQDLDIPEP